MCMSTPKPKAPPPPPPPAAAEPTAPVVGDERSIGAKRKNKASGKAALKVKRPDQLGGAGKGGLFTIDR